MQQDFSFLKFLKSRVTKTLLILLLASFNSVFADNSELKSQQGMVFPVVNFQNPQSNISKNGLSAIFKMRLRTWNDGTSVIVYVLNDDNPTHKQFSKQILNVFPHQLRRAWNKAVFSGSGQAPIELENKMEMINKLEANPGAIGYLSQEDITDKIRILDVR